MTWLHVKHNRLRSLLLDYGQVACVVVFSVCYSVGSLIQLMRLPQIYYCHVSRLLFCRQHIASTCVIEIRLLCHVKCTAEIILLKSTEKKIVQKSLR